MSASDLEVVMDRVAAERLTNRISLISGTVREGITKLVALVEEAKAGNAHVALGYRSWTEYLAVALGSDPIALPTEQRRELVGWLTSEGMSSRAIAPIVGTTHSTVVRDAQVVRDAPPLAPATPPAAPQDLAPDREHEVRDDADLHHDDDGAVHGPAPENEPVERGPVVGMDGKTYPRREPRPQRRRSFPDTYRTAVWDLDKARRRLEDLHADDRFAGYRKELEESYNELLTEIAGTVNGLSIEIVSGGVFPVKRGEKPISTRELRAAETGGPDATLARYAREVAPC